ncbi:kinase-like domain-containing protein [Paraphysoderma sedebokerense]|nr:kinase-like domain-containing protein [Paraphysoderma sedebokerense]
MDVWSHYKKIKVVGRGAFGIATVCKRLKDSSLVVIKEIYTNAMSEDEKKQSLNEIQVLSMLRHPNIISYFDSYTIDTDDIEKNVHGDLLIVMEFADGGNLQSYVSSQKEYLSEKEVLNLFCQIALALHIVHSHNILHRDLKTSNVLISGSGSSKVLKLGDFGISKLLSGQSKALTVVGTPNYLSPELCEGKPYNEKSDIWALGCILYELCTLKMMFNGSTLPAVVMRIMKGIYEPIPKKYSPQIDALIKSMCNPDPDKRPDMNVLVSSPFLQSALIEAQVSIGRVDTGFDKEKAKWFVQRE